MIQSVPPPAIEAELKAFVERVNTLSTSEDLAAFLKDFSSWLKTPGISNSDSRHTIDGVWGWRMNGAPFFLADWHKEALLREIHELKFEF